MIIKWLAIMKWLVLFLLLVVFNPENGVGTNQSFMSLVIG